MSGYDYNKSAKAALKLLTKFGSTQTIRRTALTQTNPWETPTTSDTEYPCEAVITNYSSREIDGVNILATDRRAVVPAAGLEIVPVSTDRFIADSITYTIQSIKLIKPASVIIAYVLQVRTA